MPLIVAKKKLVVAGDLPLNAFEEAVLAQPNLRWMYRFEEADTGETAVDESANGYDATYNAAGAVALGEASVSAEFGGAMRVQHNSSTALSRSGLPDQAVTDMSVGVWVYAPTLTVNDLTLAVRESGSGSTGWAFQIRASQDGSNDRFDLYSGSSAGNGPIGSTGNFIPRNQWNLISLSRSGTNRTAYVNGVQKVTESTGNTGALATAPAISIGISSAGNDTESFVIDDAFHLLGTALTAAEWLDLYNLGIGA